MFFEILNNSEIPLQLISSYRVVKQTLGVDRPMRPTLFSAALVLTSDGLQFFFHSSINQRQTCLSPKVDSGSNTTDPYDKLKKVGKSGILHAFCIARLF